MQPNSGSDFGTANLTVLTLYLLSMLAVGFYWARKNKSTDDYFRGAKAIPWWVAGLSIYATMLSSLTYMGVPAKAYSTNWEYFLGYPCILLVTLFVIRAILPFFRNLDATSAYEYLEKRFNPLTRRIGSFLFIFFQIGRMALVIFLSALALNTITHLTLLQCILLLGVLSIIYSTLGGIEAVAWSDAIQSIVLLFGAFLCLFLILHRLEGGWTSFMTIASENQKFRMIHWDWSFSSYTTPAFWVLILGGMGQNLVSYSSDQAVVQRYMTTPSLSLAARSLWTNGLLAIPTGLLFFFLGTSLFVFYQQHPERLDTTFSSDAILPLFISRELPAGVAGLVVAGIFAAAQSTISTSMNSISTAWVTDFLRPVRPNLSENQYLTHARSATLVAGALGTLLAISFHNNNVKSLLDQFFAILGLLGGSLGGVFLLGMFTTRANSAGAILGMILGACLTYLIQHHTETHVYLHATLNLATTFLAGWALSFLFPNSPKHLPGLTTFTHQPH